MTTNHIDARIRLDWDAATDVALAVPGARLVRGQRLDIK